MGRSYPEAVFKSKFPQKTAYGVIDAAYGSIRLAL